MTPVKAFDLISYVGFAVVAVLIAMRWKNRKDYWWAFIGLATCFIWEWVADWSYWYLLYNREFTMMFDRLPMMMPFAFTWYFTLMLILCLENRHRLDAMHLWKQVLLLFVIFYVWDFFVEGTSTYLGVYKYHVDPGLKLFGILPWYTPVNVSYYSVALYYVHKFMLGKAEEKNWSWGKGCGIFLLGYHVYFAFNQILLYSIVRIIFDLQPAATYFTE